MSSEVAQVDDVRVRSGWRGRWAVLLAVALGGGIGASARYGVFQLLPTSPRHFPLGTFVINVLGCLLIGVLMTVVTEVRSAHPLTRPFLGVGVLGGFTTFSTYAEDFRELLRPDAVGLAFGYLAGTLVAALAAVVSGVWLTRSVIGSPRRAG